MLSGKALQTQITKAKKDSKTLIPQDSKWKYINLNPSAPSIKGLVKKHKPEQPIRPIVNRRHATAYKLSKLFTNKIHRIAPLPNAFNVKNTKELIQNLKDTPWLPHFTFASLDIKNLYPNIPVKETKTILENMLTQCCRPPNAAGTSQLVRRHHKTKLLHQQRHNNPTLQWAPHPLALLPKFSHSTWNIYT
jgi:hypothetical protein